MANTENTPTNSCGFDVFQINNKPIKNPSSLKYTRSVLDDGDSSYRDINGILQRSIIRDDVVKLECSWNAAAMTPDEVKTLLQLTEGDFFWLTYFDPYEYRVVTKEFYVSDKELEAYLYRAPVSTDLDPEPSVSNVPVWESISFNFISR